MIMAVLSMLVAQSAPATCTAMDIDLPPAMSAWRVPEAARPTIRPGGAMTIGPSTPLTLEVTQAGTYGVAVDQGAWIDVARGGDVLRSTAHGRGPACSTIRKIVSFALEPGRYAITFSRTQAPAIRVMVVREP
ncbi:MAG TPA: hypothetical protein VMG08_17300 [Allosphingosinicella sp.]|nr:hypothetical protein [Allosphingosinicella sp.]